MVALLKNNYVHNMVNLAMDGHIYYLYTMFPIPLPYYVYDVTAVLLIKSKVISWDRSSYLQHILS